jgi:diketogulonate reductase-like aldo/keto reductase
MLKLMAVVGIGTAGQATFVTGSGALRMRTVPHSGEQLPAIGLGTYRTFDVDSDARSRAGVKEVLRQFVEIGGRVIDSSPMYGRAETVMGDLTAALAVQDKIFYATKVWTSGRDAGIRQMQQSMRRLRVERIDLMQIHNLVDWQTHIKTLYAWKQEGRIRYIGITHYTSSAFDELAAIMKTESADFVQLPYSVASREAENTLLPLAAERGIAVLVNEPFEQGSLFRLVRGRPLPPWAAEFDCRSWAQFFLKYVLAHAAVTCPIPATSNPEHLVDDMQAGLGRLPDAAQRKRMAEYVQAL